MKVFLTRYSSPSAKVHSWPVVVEDSDYPLDFLIQELLHDPFRFVGCTEDTSVTIASSCGYILATVYFRANLVRFKPYFFNLPRCSTRMKAVDKWCLFRGSDLTICKNKWEAKRLLNDRNFSCGSDVVLERVRFYA